MGTIIVTSLHQGEGKTAFCAGLLVLLQRQGHKPVAAKVSASGVLTDADSLFFQQLTSVSMPASLSGLKKAAQHAPVILEGPDLLSEEGNPSPAATDLAEALDAKVVLVAHPTPSLNASTIESAARSLGTRLLGIVFNSIGRYQGHAVETALAAPLRAAELPVLAQIPEDRHLLAVTIGDIAQSLHGQFLLLEDQRDQLVDDLMIGGNVLDWGVSYFSQRESKAVIVRSDRPDIQIAALHTPTRCLVLTGGHDPLQYVRYEAQQESVPLILVQSNTLDTAKAAEALFTVSSPHHPDKAQRYAGLLQQRLDVTVVASALGLH